MPNTLDHPEVTETRADVAEKLKNPLKKSKEGKNQNNNRGHSNLNQSSLHDRNRRSRFPRPDCTINRQKRKPCTRCDGLSHDFSKCYIALGQDSDLITKEERKNFQKNTKASNFRNQVDDLKKPVKNNKNQ